VRIDLLHDLLGLRHQALRLRRVIRVLPGHRGHLLERGGCLFQRRSGFRRPLRQGLACLGYLPRRRRHLIGGLIKLAYRLVDRFGNAARKEEDGKNRDGQENGADDQDEVPDGMRGRQEFIGILGHADAPSGRIHRRETGDLLDTLEHVIHRPGLLGQHLVHDFLHARLRRQVQLQNELLLRMGDDQSFRIRHVGITGVADLNSDHFIDEDIRFHHDNHCAQEVTGGARDGRTEADGGLARLLGFHRFTDGNLPAFCLDEVIPVCDRDAGILSVVAVGLNASRVVQNQNCLITLAGGLHNPLQLLVDAVALVRKALYDRFIDGDRCGEFQFAFQDVVHHLRQPLCDVYRLRFRRSIEGAG